MAGRNASVPDTDWDDPVFASANSFNDFLTQDSPGYSAFESFTDPTFYANDMMRNPSRSGPSAAGAQQQQPMAGKPAGASAESSSQDSASDSSGRRKRKVTESPESAAS
ncbi:SPT3 Dosage dependent suppressor of Ty-induced promoter mutations-like protein, partial [Teratosphaeriaceae sp. CCFEE 6253]